MRRIVLTALAATALVGSAIALSAATPDAPAGPPSAEQMQQMMENRAVMLDAALGGLKSGLQLTAEQEKAWAPFETAVRDAAKARLESMKAMMAMRMQGQPPSPVARLDFMASHMADMATHLKAIAEAAKPLYDGLNDTQKRHFDLLAHRAMMAGHGRGGMGMGGMGMGGMGMGGPGMGGMGMDGMGRGEGMGWGMEHHRGPGPGPGWGGDAGPDGDD